MERFINQYGVNDSSVKAMIDDWNKTISSNRFYDNGFHFEIVIFHS